MNPPPVKMAHEIAPLLSDCTWAIGGSTLLHHYGLEPAPSDLDIVVVERDFDECAKRLIGLLGQSENVQHPRYASKRFARFRDRDLPQVDLMAGISGSFAFSVVDTKQVLRQSVV